MITFQIGEIALALERGVLQGQPGPRRLSDQQWSTTNQYKMAYGQKISINLRNSFPNELSCRTYFKGAVLSYSGSVQSSFRQPIYNWEQRPTANLAISRLIPPSDIVFPGEEKIEHYQFESLDLVDFRGEKQLFIIARDLFPGEPASVTMSIWFAPLAKTRDPPALPGRQ